MKSVKEIFGIKESVKQEFKNPERQSIEQTEDYAIKKVVNTQEGTVEKVPVNGNDIVNKTYSDGGSGDKFLLNTGDTGTGTYNLDIINATLFNGGELNILNTVTPSTKIVIIYGAGGSGGSGVIFVRNSGGTTTVGLFGAQHSYINRNDALALGTSAINATAQLAMTSTVRGFLPPRMTTAQKNTLGGLPATEGLIVYDLTTHKLCIWTGAAWETFTSA